MNTFTLAQVVEIRRNSESDWEEGIVTRVWDNGRYVTVGLGPENKSLFVRLVEQVRPSQKLAAWREAKNVKPASRRSIEIEVPLNAVTEDMTILGYTECEEWAIVLVTPEWFMAHFGG